jgi:hypothetical protein
MVLVSLVKVMEGPIAGSMKLVENRPFGVQFYRRSPKMFWVTKTGIVRNLPITAVRPTPRLAEWRYIFATTASEWKGQTGVGSLKQDSRSKKHLAGDKVLKVQEVAQEKLKAAAARITKTRAATYDATTGRYRSYTQYRIHTVGELAKLAGITPAPAAK